MPVRALAVNTFRFTIASAVLCLCILAAAFYFVSDHSKTDATTRGLRTELAERDRIIAELRHGEHSSNPPNVLRADPSPAHAAETNSVQRETADLAAAQARLEAVAKRMEERLTQLEKQMKQARLIPMTPQEREAELRKAKEYLARAHDQLDTQTAEVRRQEILLSVPDAVKKLPPHEAASDPLYQGYRAYFGAKIQAGYAQSLVTATENEIAQFLVKGARFD